MTTPFDLEISAKTLIGEYGVNAYDFAKKRAHELRAMGDTKGATVFEQIAKSVRRLETISNDNTK